MNTPKKYLNVQQTPKPAAQLPSIVPDLALHSVLVKQVPMSPDVLPVHILKSSDQEWTIIRGTSQILTCWEMSRRKTEKIILQKSTEIRKVILNRKSNYFHTFLSKSFFILVSLSQGSQKDNQEPQRSREKLLPRHLKPNWWRLLQPEAFYQQTKAGGLPVISAKLSKAQQSSLTQIPHGHLSLAKT